MKTLQTNSHYKSFIKQRNAALELLLNLALSDMDSSIDLLKQSTLEIISYGLHTKALITQRLEQAFHNAYYKIAQSFYLLRKNAYTLSLTGEAEAIRRALGKAQIELGHEKLNKLYAKDTPSKGSIEDRVELYLGRLKNRILDAYKLSAITNETANETLLRIERAFPKTKKIAKRKKRIDNRKLYEAEKPGLDLVSGFIDDASWNDLVDSYKRAYELDLRGPEYTVGRAKDERYAWEVEKELTEDFVASVRDGQIDAAKENGIRDFIWIAILDDKTDECCYWRDGLSTKEIERALKTTHKDDSCGGTTPPIHTSCRCDISPMTDKDFADEASQDLGDFETWLTK